MVPNDDRHAAPPNGGFAESASRPAVPFLREVWDFLRHTKKWWLAPVVLILLLVSALVMLSGTAAAPLIYSLF